MNGILVAFIAFSVLFVAAGGLTFIWALTGTPIYREDHKAVLYTPFAVILLFIGTLGLLTLKRAPTTYHKNKNKARLQLLVGYILFMAAYFLLEQLWRMCCLSPI